MIILMRVNLVKGKIKLKNNYVSINWSVTKPTNCDNIDVYFERTGIFGLSIKFEPSKLFPVVKKKTL